MDEQVPTHNSKDELIERCLVVWRKEWFDEAEVNKFKIELMSGDVDQLLKTLAETMEYYDFYRSEIPYTS